MLTRLKTALKNKRKYCLMALALTLAIFLFLNLNSHILIAGWDNFSTSLNPSLNLLRTFTSWRSYRGFGTASDSEMADIFRQLLSYLISIFFGINFVDQIVIIVIYILGGFAFYYLLNQISDTRGSKYIKFLATLFYLFNLHTVATFYFPLTPLLFRFLALPLLLAVFIKTSKEGFRLKNTILFIITSLLTTSSYLTATFFISTCALLAFSFLDFKYLKNKIILFILFLLLNSFWLFNFVSYSISYAKSVALSSTFIEVNQIQLNRNNENLSFEKIFLLYPSFFDSKPKEFSAQKQLNLHPLSYDFDTKNINYTVLWIFPFFALIGNLLILATRKYKLYWIPILTTLLIFILRQQLEPVGWLYSAITNNIPYFEILFRFGDTKFHPILAVLFSISAFYTLLCIEKITKKYNKIFYTTLTIVFLLYLMPFKFTFSNLVSPILKVKIPSAYFEIAQIINNDSEYFRVVHIPNEKVAYWKPYSWGYFGSTFFAYILNKPLVERTFEPGNIATDYFNQEMDKNIRNEDAENLYKLFAQNNVKYIVLDETIDNKMQKRNLLFWGNLNKEKYIQNIKQLEILGSLILETKKEIDGSDIYLYKVNNTNRYVQSLNEAIKTNTNFYSYNGANYYLDDKNAGLYFPFLESSKQLDTVKFLNKTPYIEIEELNKDKYILADLFINRNDKTIEILLKNPNSPQTLFSKQINAKNYLPSNKYFFVEGSNFDENIKFSNTTLKIDDNLIPLPYLSTNNQIKIASVLVNKSSQIEVWSEEKNTAVDMGNFEYTDYANCFFDKSENYTYKFSASSDKVNISTTAGTTCIQMNLSKYLGKKNQVFNLQFINSSKQIENSNNNYNNFNLTKKELRELNSVTLNPVYNYTNVCILNNLNKNCLNKNQTINTNLKQINTFGSKKENEIIDLVLSFPAMQNSSRQDLISSAQITNYKLISKDSLNIENIDYSKIDLNYLKNLKTVSQYSFYFDQNYNNLQTYTSNCEINNSFRSTNKLNNENTTYSLYNCSNGSAIPLKFEQNNFLTWNIDYNLLAGKFPYFKIFNEGSEIYSKMLSKDQGYPDIKEFKSGKYVSTYTNIYPSENQKMYETALFSVEQNSQGMGIFSIKGFSITHLPNSFKHLAFKNYNQSQEQFENIIVTNIKKPVPSAITFNLIKTNQKKVFINVLESFDTKWEIYKSNNLFFAFLGVNKLNTEHFKTNGWSNGYIINAKDLDKNQAITVFYAGERILFVGTLATLLTIILSLFFASKLSKK